MERILFIVASSGRSTATAAPFCKCSAAIASYLFLLDDSHRLCKSPTIRRKMLQGMGKAMYETGLPAGMECSVQ